MIKKNRVKYIIIISIINWLSIFGISYSQNMDKLYEKIDLFSEVLEKVQDEYVDEIEVSPDKSDDGDDIIITVSHDEKIQKVEVNGINDCTVLVTAGTFGTGGNAGSASGGVAADNIYLKNPRGLHVTTNRILVGDQLGHVHEINEDLFNATDKDTAWRRQMGTDSIARWDGAKTAIRAVLSDTSLTSGAHFGFAIGIHLFKCYHRDLWHCGT
mgnify:CR=1 FL=1